MGRRKIEIRPIKDDRNRSVTFLKRKGGLFKKAYELGVLCSVDVAVVIIGNNKKLYEFSSRDMREIMGRHSYYTVAHEHKGPEDFAGKGGGDEDDDEDGEPGSPPRETITPPDPTGRIQHHLHRQPNLSHVSRATTSSSPPLPNGSMSAHKPSPPQPGTGSRPSSRTAAGRRLSNLAPPHYTTPQAQMAQSSYGYAPHQQYQHSANMPRMPQHNASFSVPQAQMQQEYVNDRRRSGPPTYQQHQPPPTQHLQQQQQQHLQRHQQIQHIPPSHTPPQRHPSDHDGRSITDRHASQPAESYNSPPLPQPKPLAPAKQNHSIFTPIEDSRSVLAQHWGQAPPSDTPQQDHHTHRAQSIDNASMAHDGHTQAPLIPTRSASSSSVPPLPPVARSNTFGSEVKRPRLKVQIPSEASEAEEATADSSKETSVTSSQAAHAAKGVVLPPPSPSAGNPLLSAGATGPPNPFARPAPPTSQAVNRDLETPLSALPSRVMEGNMLPSPSDIWGNMFSRSNNDNMMPSPLNFQPTPIGSNGMSFKDDPDERKRKADAEAAGGEKRVRT